MDAKLSSCAYGCDEPLHVLVEIPKGSRNKYEWDEELQAIKLDRYLFSSSSIPRTTASSRTRWPLDGDPLDAMVCVTEPTFPGCVIPVKAIALFRMTDDSRQDDKVLCVPHKDPNWNTLDSLDDLPDRLQAEIEHFFSIYKQPEGKDVTVDGWYCREEALEEIQLARERWAKRESKK